MERSGFSRNFGHEGDFQFQECRAILSWQRLWLASTMWIISEAYVSDLSALETASLQRRESLSKTQQSCF